MKRFIDSFFPRFRRACTGGLAALAHLCAWSALVFGCLASPTAAAAALVFDGGAAGNCSLSEKTYTCNTFPLTSTTDTMTIADGYTVIVNGSATFDYNQSLAMSGSATLNMTGNLHIGNIKPSNLAITGGNLVSGATFTMGNQAQSITANINAVTMNLGSGSTTSITGKVTATGNISIGSHCTINGAVSGNIIDTDSPTVINGNVTARTSFTLASGSSVTGDVSAGYLYLQASKAIVTGNATVKTARLDWAGRVTKMIYCTAGTTNGQCDCVTNNSGFDVNTDPGPHCAAAPAASILDHFLIVHDGSASACTPEPVTVKACVDSACTSLYTGGVNVTLQPGGGTFAIGSSGVSTNATVSQSSLGTATLAVSAASVAAVNAVQCDNTSDSNAAGGGACGMDFNNNVGLSLSMQDQYSATSTPFTLKATIYDPKTNSCPAAFAGQTKTVQLGCTYRNPAGGYLPVKVGTAGQASSAFAALNGANASTGRCDGSTRDFNVTFASDGTVPFSMYYADVGLVSINASMPEKNVSPASGNAVVAPAAFQIRSYPTSTTAGVPFKVIAAPVNAEGTATPNFGKEAVPETVNFSKGALDTAGCKLASTDLGSLAPAPTTSMIATGVLGNITYTEAGALNIQVEQASTAYLGGGKPRPAAVRTSTASGCGAITSVPAYFEVREGRVGSTADKANFYYSGEPVDVTVTAMNAFGKPTVLYDNAYGYSKQVLLRAWDAAGANTIPATTGGLSGSGASTALGADAFKGGVARVSADAAPPLVFSFGSKPGAPLKVRLRAEETVSGGVSSAKAGNYGMSGEDIYEARSGRVRIASRFGSAKGDLVLPVMLQYWTGGSWVQNLNHSDALALPPIPASAIALQSTAPLSVSIVGMSGISQGLGSLTLRPTGGTGTATVAINLGAATDNSCLPAPRPVTTGAKMPWLRGPNGICAPATAATADPAARATFGVYAPEAKRLIHTREVFN